MSQCSSKTNILSRVGEMCKLLRKVMQEIPQMSAEYLACKVVISKTEYKNHIEQKIIVNALRKKGINVMPGQQIEYLYGYGGVVLPEDYKKPSLYHYRKLLLRSLFIILQPLGVSRQELLDMLDRQAKIPEYFPVIKQQYVPITKKYSSKKGLSEKLLRRRLESNGWLVWRGSLLNILHRDDLYPNVRKKYTLLNNLLQKHHAKTIDYLKYLCFQHGMPDFICYRNNHFKFVECKLGHEQLSIKQKKCIMKLLELGYDIEVHKFVFNCTKLRIAYVDIFNQDKIVIEKQERLKLRY